jgi:hypothetical protein
MFAISDPSFRLVPATRVELGSRMHTTLLGSLCALAIGTGCGGGDSNGASSSPTDPASNSPAAVFVNEVP